MKIKNLLALMLAVLMLTAIAACNTGTSNSPSPSPSPSEESNETADGEEEGTAEIATEGTTETEDETPAEIPDRQPVRLTLATGGTAGTYYPFGGAIAQVIADRTGYISANAIATGASAENIQQIGDGESHIAIVQNDVMDYAFNATNTWTAEAVKDLATLMTLYPEVCQVIVTADSGINSVADLAGRRVSTGDVGSGVEANAIQILEAYGMTVSDIQQEHLSFAASADAVRDRIIDAFFVTAGTPNTAVLDLQTSRELRILSFEDDIIDAMIAKYPFYAKYTITQEEYSFLDSSVDTVAVQATLICAPDLDEQVAYDIVKAIIEGKVELEEAHAKGAFIDAEYAVQGVSVAFHPGAARYFRELGVID